MKRFILFAALGALTLQLFAQETETMERRAREMHRVIALDDREQWKAFMKENYTQSLIDKPMRTVVESSDGRATAPASETKHTDNLEAKAGMFERLHDDFGKSKIVSIKPDGEKLEMVVKNSDGLSGTFKLKFSKDKPYLIDGLGIEVEATDQ